MFWKAAILLSIIQISVTFTVEINNIHNGYRNVYEGTASLVQSSVLTISNYNTLKEELTADEAPFLFKKTGKIGLDLNNFVRQYYEQDIDVSAPRLVFRYYQQPSIVLTLFSENESSEQIQQLNSIIPLGRDMSDLDL